MTKKIKELTDVMVEYDHAKVEDELRAEIQAGYLALENGCYTQAWEHFYKLYSYKDNKLQSIKYFRGEGAHGLCKVMQECANDDELVGTLIDTDPDLVRKGKTRAISGDFARKFIGRKYLVYAADTCGFYPALTEYALNCVGSGHAKSFVFEYNDRDAQVGLHWANRLIGAESPSHKAMGYMVHAKYHFARYTQSKSPEEMRLFCENVIAARNLVGDNNEYTMYFYAHMCTNPNFQHFEQGRHYDTKKGYQLFCKVVDSAKDPDLVSSARNIKTMLETKYPSKIK